MPRNRRMPGGPTGTRFVAPVDVEISREPADARNHETLAPLPLDLIGPAPWQSRRRFDPAALDALAASIAEHGVMQPIIVRRVAMLGAGAPAYELICGERRLRAARLLVERAALDRAAADQSSGTIPARIVDVGDVAARAMTLIENLVRTDISALEIAHGYRALRDSLASSGEVAGVRALARHTSHTPSIVSEYLRIADALSDDLCASAGVDPASGDIGRVTKAALLRVASCVMMEDRIGALRGELRRVSGGRTHAYATATLDASEPIADPALAYWRDGGISLRIRTPVVRMTAAAAEHTAHALAPALRALIRRAEPEGGYCFSHSGPGYVLTVPDAQRISGDQRRRLRAELDALLLGDS